MRTILIVKHDIFLLYENVIYKKKRICHYSICFNYYLVNFLFREKASFLLCQSKLYLRFLFRFFRFPFLFRFLSLCFFSFSHSLKKHFAFTFVVGIIYIYIYIYIYRCVCLVDWPAFCFLV